MSYRYDGYAPTSHGFLESRPDSKGGYHGGADNAAAPGTPVYAEYGGKVFRSGPIKGYGMSVVIETTAPDGTPFYQLYGHLGPGPLPTPGTPIEAGKQIPGAEVGTTEYVHQMGGISTGPHLHREIISGRKLKLNPTGRLGVVSSDITHKADPDTFDINNPMFPYEPEGAQLPPPQPKHGSAATGVAPQAQPQRVGSSLQRIVPPADNSSPEPSLPQRSPNIYIRPLGSTSSPLSPGMAIPGARGATSIGGPAGPTPLMPPANSGSSAPAPLSAPPTLPLLRFAPEMPQNFDPFTTPSPSDAPLGADAVQASATAGAARRLTSIYPEVGPLGRNLPGWRPGSDTSSGLANGQPNALSLSPVWSPSEALLAPGRNRAGSDWGQPLPFNQASLPAQGAPGGIPGLLMQIGAFDPSHPDDPPAGGLLRLLQDYMRNNPDGGSAS